MANDAGCSLKKTFAPSSIKHWIHSIFISKTEDFGAPKLVTFKNI